MRRKEELFLILLGSFATIYGCFIINGVVGWWVSGNTYTFRLSFYLQFAGYCLWFLAAGAMISRFAAKKYLVLIPSSLIVAGGLYLSSGSWVDPEAPLLSYITETALYHLPILLVVPIFAAVAFLAKSKSSPNKALKQDRPNRAAS